jgi:hypothetical protein
LAVQPEAAFTESFPLMCTFRGVALPSRGREGWIFLKLPRSDHSGFCRIEAASAEERSRADDFFD